jgi:hypothetical protein
MIIIKFDTDNEAFRDGNGFSETARILRKIADEFEQGDYSDKVRDLNGNSVGTVFCSSLCALGR